jgi:serine/threonine protein phosphatase 1
MSSFNPVLKIPANRLGRDFITTDIHGCYAVLEALLLLVDFNPAIDRLFVCGDLVDRGPESFRVLEFLRQPWFFSVRGNHEDFCLVSGVEGVCTIHATYGGLWFGAITSEQRAEVINAFRQLPYLIDLEMPSGLHYGIVHAEMPFNDWDECVEAMGEHDDLEGTKIAQTLLWGRDKIYRGDERAIGGIDRLYLGHTVVEYPYQISNAFYIDTGCGFEKGVLTLRCLTTETDYVSLPFRNYY